METLAAAMKSKNTELLIENITLKTRKDADAK